ncbi:hypothetical protein AZE42_03055 [Rhizopogon vesiculosus]|uniref:Uncharacterized protein n=1 Tax=Rhizopogon vesiculosus TaxID=180088 RepID=A0A1J8QC83_9AGAM|nr:hypothetical protein AZE42_03055 [Rhizopogon vesiculosus]
MAIIEQYALCAGLLSWKLMQYDIDQPRAYRKADAVITLHRDDAFASQCFSTERIPEFAMGRGLSGPEMSFSDTTLAAFQRIAQPLFDPFQPRAYIHENQQLQALEMRIVKITTERDTILHVIIFFIDFALIRYQIKFPAACKCCTPSRLAAPWESDLPAVLSQLLILGSPFQSSGPTTSSYTHSSGSPSGERYKPFVHPQMPQADRHKPRPSSHPGHAIKERETGGHRGLNFGMQQQVNGESSSIVQHLDAGCVLSEVGLLRELPPAYDSIIR